MKIKKIFYLLLVTNCIVNAQNNQDFVPKVTPLPPDVAGLMKYVEVPVDTYNGTFRYDIPLYNLKEGDLNLPVSMSYFNNGLKVEEESSSIGLGWSLNAGGVIQMIPKDLNYCPLDLVPWYAPVEASPNPNTDYYLSELNTVRNITHGGCYTKDSQGNIRILETGEVNSYINSTKSYDMYMYNFAGHSGKFIDIGGGNFIDLNKSNIKFERLSNGNIIATTTEGNKYFFNTNTKITNLEHTPLGIIYSYTFYVSQIVSPKNDEINFSYILNQIETVPQLSQSFVKSLCLFNPGITRNFDIKKHTLKEYILDEINTSSTKIKFFSSSRLDIYNGKKLNQIKVYKQGESNHISDITFSYDYFVGSSNYGDFTTFPVSALGNNTSSSTIMPNVSLDNKSKRLKLLDIAIKGRINNYQALYYRFDYNTTALPYKTSLAQDLWGYFNGSNNPSLLPNVNNLGYYDNNIPGYLLANPQAANRKSTEQYMKAGVLTKITQPTKGYSEIEYEINAFEELPNTSSGVAQVEKIIYDINSTTEKSLEFTIPNISMNQVQTLTIWLACNSYGPCDVNSSDCYPAYFPSSYQHVHPNDNRLYARLEKKNGTTWSLIEEYDKLHHELVTYGQYHNACGIFQKALDLDPGIYRMTVNYPDSKTGHLGGPWAFMSMKYFENSSTPQPNTGAGLRVKSVSDYNFDTERVNLKNYVYRAGKLLSKPIFYSFQSFIGLSTYFPAVGTYSGCPNVTILDGYDSNPSSLTNIPSNFNEKIVLSSRSTFPYSYGANGSLVGYGEVDINYGENSMGDPTKYIGMETYKYKNQYDDVNHNVGELPGASGGKIFGNGSVIEKTVKKIFNPGMPGPAYFTQQKEEYQYELKDLKVYWAYKMDYFLSPSYTDNGVNIPKHSRFNFIHFYPIKSAIQTLKKKTVTEYNTNGLSISNTVNYSYNSKHQIVSEKMTNNFGEIIESKNYTPIDLVTTSQQSAEMQQLINENRIDIPIRTETFIDGVRTSTQETKYQNNASTSNILLPKEIHTVKGSSAIDLTSNESRKITIDNYDEKGNIVQYTQENGIPVTFLWGYNKAHPIAKIENATYAAVQQYEANLQTLSNGTDEASLITALNALRTALPNTMVTTYTYKPLIGISTVTNSQGYTTTYHYDNYNRLEFVKDQDGNNLSENEYHYKN